MINNYFTKEESHDIYDNNETKIGVDVITYKIMKISNTKNLTLSNTYSIIVTHRVKIGGSGWKPNIDYQSKGFLNYPILMNVESGIVNVSNSKTDILLKRVFPKTINANVEESSNSSSDKGLTTTNQTSSGSSSSNVNTFGIDLSFGFFGLDPTGSIGLDYSHSWENSHSRSAAMGHANTKNFQATSGNEMSVKDWSAFSSIKTTSELSDNYQGEFIQWNWGQTYPWNIFEYKHKETASMIELPEDVVDRMLYTNCSKIGSEKDPKNILLPPSDLSLFGIDFTMAAEWELTFPDNLVSIESLTFGHNIGVQLASHSKEPNSEGCDTLSATLLPESLTPINMKEPIDIGEYALVPLLEGQRIGSGIGFQKNLFDISPIQSTSTFKIRSRGNDILVTGNGFNSVMTAKFETNYTGSGSTLNIAFKVADERTQYALILKHWKGSSGGDVVLTCNINNNKTVINVTDNEGQGSSNNIDQLELRNFDLTSINFHDYLVRGWNEVKINILPLDNTDSSEYTISALSVEG